MVRVKKEKPICTTCQTPILRKNMVEEVGKDMCYKCFISYRRSLEATREQREREAKEAWLSRKKWWCPKCKVALSDFDIWLEGTDFRCGVCQKCFPKKMQGLFKKKIEKENVGLVPQISKGY